MKNLPAFHSVIRHHVSLALAGLLLSPLTAQAIDYTWDCSADDYWQNTSCWNPDGTSTSTDRVYVGSAYYTPTGTSTLTISDATGNAYASNLTVDNTGTYAVNLNQTGGILTTTYIDIIGYNGTGSFTQSGGTHTVKFLSLGYYSGSNGSYELSGTGSLSIENSVRIGSQGSGSFIQSGGTNTLTGDLILGSSGGSNGSYELSGTGSM